MSVICILKYLEMKYFMPEKKNAAKNCSPLAVPALSDSEYVSSLALSPFS